MGTSLVIMVIAVYLLLGAILLFLFDLVTKRLRSKFTQATGEMQSRLAWSGNYVGGKLASILFLGAVWLFWPAIFVGVVAGKNKKEGTDEQR